MEGLTQNLALPGYTVAALAYLGVLIVAVTQSKRRSSQLTLYAALIAGSLWAATLAYAPLAVGISASTVYYVETVHDAAWLFFFATMLSSAAGSRAWPFIRFGGFGLAVGLLLVGVVLDLGAPGDTGDAGSAQLLIVASVLCSLYALYLLEQTYRNGRASQRRGLRFVCLGLGGIFAYDLFLYTNTILAGELDDQLWNARGFVVAGSLFVVAYGLLRTGDAITRLFVSRKVVAYGATLLGTGVYFVVVGVFGYYLKSVGGEWGEAVQVAGLFLATLLLVLALFSRRLRARFNVFLNKHFFESKYDYREEWLRLMRTLGDDQALPLRKRCIRALAQIIEADHGWLWLRGEEGLRFECASSWNVSPQEGEIELHPDLVSIMEARNWIVNLDAEADSHTSEASLRSLDALPAASLVIPLVNNGDLIGFIVSGQSTSFEHLTYEDIDVLKTAAQQVASHIAQDIATEDLAESRQFEAVNRLTTFLMHDLKNLVAQQSMIVQNAQRHRRNPDFVDDMVDTISNSVKRMKHVLRQLGRADHAPEMRRISLRHPASNAIDRCARGEPAPRFEAEGDDVFVLADPEQLSTVLQNLISNAQDATDPDGSITVTVRDARNGTGVIEVADSGSGMSADFIRERLFKPFDSTKGAQGMGVGAYQAREYLRSIGGDLLVHSQPEEGTTVVVEIPVKLSNGNA